MKYNFDEVIDRTGTDSMKLECIPSDVPKDHICLSVADMDFSCAEPILKSLHERIDKRILGYSNYDNDPMKDSVVSWFKRRYQWDINKNDMFYSPGVVPAFAILIQSITEEGDGVIIQKPVYYPFSVKIESSGRKLINNALLYRNGCYEMDFEDLDKKLQNSNNKGVLFCSPHNPSGRVWTEEELRRLVDLCKKYDKWIISDEIHCDLTRMDVKFHPLLKVAPDYKDRIMVCTAPTKTFNLAGMGISNIIIPNPEYQKKYKFFIGKRIGVEVNPLAMVSMIAAYNECEDWLDEVRTYIDSNIKYVNEFVKDNFPKAHVVKTEGTYLVWIDFRAYSEDPKKLENWIRYTAGVVLDEGYVFGDEGIGFERINVATPRSILEDCMNRLKRTFPF